MRTSIDMPASRPNRRARRLLGRSAACLVLVSLVPGGCASSSEIGPPISTTQQESSASFDSGALRSIGYSRGWRAYPIVTRRQQVEHVVAYEDVVLVIEGGSTLSCIDAQDGAVRWSTQLESPVTPFLGIERQGNLVYANSSSELYVLDVLSGELRARQTLPLVVTTGPTRHEGQLLFGCADGQVFSYVPTRQIKLWGNQLDHPVQMEAVMVDGIASFVSTGGDVLFIDPARGTAMMRAGGGQRTNALFDGPGATPVAAPGMLLVPSEDQSLWAFTPASSRNLWRVPTQGPITGRPMVYGDHVYIDLPEYGFSAVNLGTGDITWSLGDVGGRLVSVRDGLLVVFDPQAEVLTQIDAPTGDVFGSVPVGGVDRVETAELEDAPIYLITDRGLVARFNPDA
ncbi:MAG: PQQ-binding-like beta-propeller repeat protein [Phycisphaerales bacterium JB060]